MNLSNTNIRKLYAQELRIQNLSIRLIHSASSMAAISHERGIVNGLSGTNLVFVQTRNAHESRGASIMRI